MKILTPIKAIRANCLDCMCGSAFEVKLCPTDDCPLYPYRFGHNPNIKKRKKMTDDQKEAAGIRFAEMRARKVKVHR